MTVNLEKIFFVYVLKNKKFINVIEPHFFKNVDIQFCYSVMRKWMVKFPDSEIPTPKQFYEMVSIEDPDNRITKDIFLSILKVDLSEYDEDRFIKPKFKAWILINRIKSGTVDTIDETRNIEDISDYDKAIEIANKIKGIVDESTKLDFDSDDDLGSDFDDADSHNQDHSVTKIKTGFDSLDTIMCGGFDIQTLTVLMAPSNAGKSVWMQNLSVSCASHGYNVLYITLEMSERKTLKRMGSMRLKIPIEDYDQVSLDKEYMSKKIKSMYKSGAGSDLFDNKVGKIIVKFYPAGTSTLSQFESLINDIKSKRGIDIDLVVVDYITLISAPKGTNDNLYQKGKFLAEGLRAMAAKFNCAVLTATQVAKEAWGNNDLTLENVSESKGIVETADLMFGIIRTEEMKRNNKYRLKLLKIRDGSFDRSNMIFDLNPKFLTLENDTIISAIQ